MSSIPFLMLVLCLETFQVSAHPIAQGSLAVNIEPAAIKIRMHANLEQLFVANHFEVKKGTTLEQAISEHAEYIQRHFFVEEDQVPLTGQMEGWERSGTESVDYNFIYRRLSEGDLLTLRQNLLNEVEFAPGNPWEATFLVASRSSSGEMLATTALLTSKSPLQIPIRATPEGADRLFGDYVDFGIRHIVEGTDHLLFTGALVLGSYRLISLIRVITAFTVAHSLTLALSVLDLFRLTPLIVEPMIALSIIAVAVLNIFSANQKSGLREGTALFFGLFHGLGFSGGLLEVMEGLSNSGIVISLLGFTLGVELGHQVVILPLFFAFLSLRQSPRISSKSLRVLIRILSIPILAAGGWFFRLSLEPWFV